MRVAADHVGGSEALLLQLLDRGFDDVVNAIDHMREEVHAQFRDHDATLRAEIIATRRSVDRLIAFFKGEKYVEVESAPHASDPSQPAGSSAEPGSGDATIDPAAERDASRDASAAASASYSHAADIGG